MMEKIEDRGSAIGSFLRLVFDGRRRKELRKTYNGQTPEKRFDRSGRTFFSSRPPWRECSGRPGFTRFPVLWVFLAQDEKALKNLHPRPLAKPHFMAHHRRVVASTRENGNQRVKTKNPSTRVVYNSIHNSLKD
jgi:hypothetical protein